MSHTIEITGYPVGARVQFVETDIDRVINIGETGVVVESFAPNTGRNVQLADGRIVNVPTYYLQDVEPALVDISDLIDLSNGPVQLNEVYKVQTVHGFPVIARRDAGTYPGEEIILVDRGETDYDRYVIARWSKGDNFWYQGDYTSNFSKAVEIFQGR